MTRQRIRPSLKRSVYQDCPHCKGMAQVKTCESMSLEVMRLLQLASHREAGGAHRNPRGGGRGRLSAQQEASGDRPDWRRRAASRSTFRAMPAAPAELLEFLCLDKNNNEVKVLAAGGAAAPAVSAVIGEVVRAGSVSDGTHPSLTLPARTSPR